MRQEMVGFWDGSGVSWTICKQSAPCFRQITTPAPHHSIFTGRMLFLTPSQQCQSTEGSLIIIWDIVICCSVGLWGSLRAVMFTSPRLWSRRLCLCRHQVAWCLAHLGRYHRHRGTHHILGESDRWQVTYDMIHSFNMQSSAVKSQLNVLHRTKKRKSIKSRKLKTKTDNYYNHLTASFPGQPG